MGERTHYERIIGGTQEERKAASQELQTIFDARSEELAEYEIEKSHQDVKILQKTEAVVDRMVAEYGGEPKLIPPDHIYVLKTGSVLTMTQGKLERGICKPLGLKIGVERGKSGLLFAGTVAHELFHLKSYKSARVGKSERDIRLYRSGLSMIDRKDSNEEAGEERQYFARLEEAVVAECTKKFLDEISQDSAFIEEIEAVKKFRDWVVAYYRRHRMPEEKVKELERAEIYF